jgi:AraC family transcriptional regulator
MAAVVRRLHDGPLLRVERYACGGDRPDRSQEEAASQPEIVFPLRGVFVRELRGHTHVADANQVLFFEPGEGYRVRHPAGCGDASLILALRTTDGDTLHDLGWRAGLSHRLAPVPARLGVARLLAALEAKDGLADEVAWDVVGCVLEDAGKGPRQRDRRAHARQAEAVRAVQLALARDPRAPLAALARQAGVSPFHLSRLFRRHTGTSLRDYRNRTRVGEAARRLAEGERDLTRLALQLGFWDHAHFTRVFRSVSGVSPSRFREGSRANRA